MMGYEIPFILSCMSGARWVRRASGEAIVMRDGLCVTSLS
jgi:hypothetical protein